MRILPFALFFLTMLCSMALGEPKRVVAYVPNWIDLEAFSKTIDFSKLTHINIAFENPANKAGDLTWNPQNDHLISRARKNGVKVLLSIGGGSASGDPTLKARYADLLGEKHRAAFAARLAALVEEHQLDGLDVDIEGPSIDDNYGPFMDALAAQLKPKGRLLTAALSKGYGGGKVPSSVLTRLDFLNIMAYDGTGPWNPKKAGQHSSFEFAQANVRYWLDRGLPKAKAVLGVPFYGYGFGAAYQNDGYAYADIVKQYPGADQQDQVGNTLWYNGIPTIRKKARYVLSEDLGGIMIWSLDNDAPGEFSLLSVISTTLAPPLK